MEDTIKITSFSPFGYEGALVSVEVDLRRGIPAVDLVGLADNAVKESRERMRAAVRNSGFDFPPERVLISLSPADVKKEGAGFDLAIALAVLQEKLKCEGSDSKEDTDVNKDSEVQGSVSFSASVLVMGELELSGRVRPVRGVHAALSTAVDSGIHCCIIPAENAQEAAGLASMKVFTVDHLGEAFHLLLKLDDKSFYDELYNQEGDELSREGQTAPVEFADIPMRFDYRDVEGQPFFLRALQVAAAGWHNLIAYGPPGCGKTLALQHFNTLLPLLTTEDALPVTRIYSLAGKLKAGTTLMWEAPFRMPHQSSSLEGIIGGGPHCRPGEISLAHNGVLFLDEASEFRGTVLQSLRVPLEEGKIALSRAGRSTEFPARFQLLVATNPCPCGNYGSQDKICLCSARSVEQYWRRFSAPLLDRLDIRVALRSADLNTVRFGPGGNSHKEEFATGSKVAGKHPPFSTAQLREDIGKATAIQRKRQGKSNSDLNPTEIREQCGLDAHTEQYLEKQSLRHGFSVRGVHSCLKLARTIADMEESTDINFSHMGEAVILHCNEGGPGFMF